MTTTWAKNKTKINLIIDAILLVLLMAIAGLGFLIKYVLVPGYKRGDLYEGDVELYYMGLTRHEWGNIHLWLSFIFLGLMILHILLHWGMITCIFKQMIAGKTSRALIAIFTGALAIFLALAPFFVTPRVEPFQAKHHHRHTNEKQLKQTVSSGIKANPVDQSVSRTSENRRNSKEGHNSQHVHDELGIYGSMSLEEAASKYAVSVSDLTRTMNISPIDSSQKIGRLKKKYGFEMEELKDAILKLKN